MIPTGHAAMTRRDEIVERVLAKVEIVPCPALDPAPCWQWTGPTSGDKPREGYPRMSLDGRTVSVHRVMATHAFGYLHPGRKVDHLCRNRLCVNPAHLEPVTHRENCRRRDAARIEESTP